MQVTLQRRDTFFGWQTMSLKFWWHNKWYQCTDCCNNGSNISGNPNAYLKFYSLPPVNGRRTKRVALIPKGIYTKICGMAYRKRQVFF